MSPITKRHSSRTKPSEEIENVSKSPGVPFPHPLLRSPLISIQDPSFTVSDPKPTPKSAPATPARGGSRAFAAAPSSGGGNAAVTHQRVGTRERGSLNKIGKGLGDSNCLVPVYVPHFDINEDPSFWNDHNVQVVIRIRPLNGAECTSQSNKRCLVQESSQTIAWTGHPETRFTFDHVACEAITQEKLFKVVGIPMVENCMSGYNSCMFAYGQTGSGKTYTMMGEIHEIDNMLSDDRGMTPRIFEYLFIRIKKEEEDRTDERLKYSCKCSFLEIYNEQITDLLDPSSANLQLREDMKNGVYVENLKEYEVFSVKDVLELLQKGTANRKVAATHMNSESSRSHCVFTCIIESRWERDSLLHLRFGRLNLVDLAGSERLVMQFQKSSGAEGDRLKEAANINRSLSTLGLVIMTLVDIANGKNRHIPYRDSKLTFLLQDSLGGNSKTTIIANVSPSLCSASETLSTLKFAQRAKLIQNNAKVNEDASGDVMALQQQIQKLKDQVTFLIRHQNLQRSSCLLSSTSEHANWNDSCDNKTSAVGIPDALKDPNIPSEKFEFLEAALIGALRREKLVEATLRRLETENERLNRLVHQREDDAQHVKTMLRFREEKIRRLEMLADNLVSSDGYVMEENLSLSEENRVLLARIDRHPELTQFALENMRLLEQLSEFQDFYKQGEWEKLLAEVSHLRNQLLKVLEGTVSQVSNKNWNITPKKITKEDEIIKELENCRAQLDATLENNATLTREVDDLQQKLKLYIGSGESLVDNVSSAQKELNNAELLLCVRKHNNTEATPLILSLQKKLDAIQEEVNGYVVSQLSVMQSHPLKTKLEEFYQMLCLLIEENVKLSNLVSVKDAEITVVSEDWEKAVIDLTSFLAASCQSLEDAQDHIGSVMESFPRRHSCVNEHVERAIKVLIEKEMLIANLQKSLEHAQQMGLEMKSKLDSLRGAALAITEVQQLEHDENSKKALHLRSLLCEKISRVHELENTFTRKEDPILEEENNSVTSSCDKNAEECLHGITALRNEPAECRETIEIEETDPTIKSNGKLLMDAIGARRKNVNALMCEEDLSTQVKSSKRNSEENTCEHGDVGSQSNMPSHRIVGSECKDSIVSHADTEGCHKASLSSIKTKSLGVSKFLQESIPNGDPNNKEVRELIKLKSDTHLVRDETSWALGYQDSCELFTPTVMQNVLQGLENTNEMLCLMRTALDMHILQIGKLAKEDHEIYPQSDAQLVEYSIPKFKEYDDRSTPNDEQILCLIDEVGKAMNGLTQTNCQLNMLLHRTCVTQSFSGCACCSDEKSAINTENLLLDDKHPSDQLVQITLSQREESPDHEMEEPELEFSRIKQITDLSLNDARIDAAMKSKQAADLLINFEEVQKIMEEADLMLNALLTANEGVKQERDQWRRTSEQLLAGQTALVNKVQQLEAATMFQDKHYTKRIDQIDASCKEIRELTYSLEKSVQATKRTTEEIVEVVCADIYSISKELFQCIGTSRSWLENMFSEIMEQIFTLHVSCICHSSAVQQYNLVEPFAISSNGEMLSTNSMEVTEMCMGVMNTGDRKQKRASNQEGNVLFSVQQGGLQNLAGRSSSLTCDQICLLRDFQNKYSIEEQTQYFLGTCFANVTKQPKDTLSLNEGLVQKEKLMNGLLYDIRLLQESRANVHDFKDEADKMVIALQQVQHELALKAAELDAVLVHQHVLEVRLAESETAFSNARSELEQMQKTMATLSKENSEFRLLWEDIYFKKSQADELLENEKKAIKSLEREILLVNSSIEARIASSVEEIMEDLKRVSNERDQLRAEIAYLNDKLDMACCLANENEAIAVEARQVAEASKIYAEEKEEEVKVLEHSVDELEGTVDILDRKVHELQEEAVRHQSIRSDLELKVQTLMQRMLTIEDDDGNLIADLNFGGEDSQFLRRLDAGGSIELSEAKKHIQDLEVEIACKDEEMKKYRDHISELLLHSEAQSSLFQEKFKTLEFMVSDVQTDPRPSNVGNAVDNSTMRVDSRTKRSGSPFRCISNLVQQVNCEKDQELLVARVRIKELEAVASKRQKEICMLNARLAAVDSMVHDVIRDLLGVKLDMTNYANLIDQKPLQELVERIKQEDKEMDCKEYEILNLKKQIDHFIKERDRWTEEINKGKAETLACQVKVERLQRRHQLLTAQNEMLKLDRANLHRRITELDEALKKLIGSQNIHDQMEHAVHMKGYKFPKD